MSYLVDDRLFYDLMQVYRTAPVENQVAVSEAYEAVKAAIRSEVDRFTDQLKEDIVTMSKAEEKIFVLEEWVRQFKAATDDELKSAALNLVKNIIIIQGSESLVCVKVPDVTRIARAAGYSEAQHNPERTMEIIGLEEWQAMRSVIKQFKAATMDVNSEAIAAVHQEAKRLGL